MTDNFKENYFRALRLPARSDDPAAEVAPIPSGHGVDPVALKAALDRAHELRKFEIENYWKRTNYFWLFQAAAITLFGVMVKDMIDKPFEVLLLIPAALGAVTAFVGVRTAEGSKFWQENWEAHVDALEPFVEGRLTQVIIANGGPRVSVSRINAQLFNVLFISWILIAIGVLAAPWIRSLPHLDGCGRVALGLCALALLALALVSLADQETRMKGWYWQGEKWGDMPEVWPEDALLLRHPAGGRNRSPDEVQPSASERRVATGSASSRGSEPVQP